MFDTKSHKEIELSFYFNYDVDKDKLLQTFSKLFDVSIEPAQLENITDYYIDSNTRVRKREFEELSDEIKTKVSSKDLFLTTKRKDGKHRIENNTPINFEILESMKHLFKLTIEKTRTSFKISNDKYISIDIFKTPMKIVKVEIEFLNPDEYERCFEICEKNGLKPTTMNAYKFFSRKIAFVGSASCGKTTMTRALVNHLSINYGMNIEQVSEYARTHIARYGIPNWYLQPVIGWAQERRENDVTVSSFITDSPRFLAYIYAVYNTKHQLDQETIFLMSKLYKEALYALSDYTDLIYLPIREVKQDGVRYQDSDDIEAIDRMIRSFMDSNNKTYLTFDFTSDDLNSLTKHIFQINSLPE